MLTIPGFRQRLAEVVDEVTAGEPVFAGAHRQPEVVIMSVRRYEQLQQSADRDLAVRSAIGSAALEGQHVTSEEEAALRDVLAGRISRADYLHRLLPEHFPEA